jgi:predicted transcriptional regulator of viral defense system
MKLFRRLLPRAAEQHGLITTKDAREEGGTPMALVMLAQRGMLERRERGIYLVPELAGDPLEQYQEALLRLPGAILANETALDLHELCDINPRRVHVTLEPGVRIRKTLPDWLVVHRNRLEPEEVTDLHGLAIETPARAIVDGIEGHLGARLIDQALDTARKRNVLTTREEQTIEHAIAIQRVAQLNTALAQ